MSGCFGDSDEDTWKEGLTLAEEKCEQCGKETEICRCERCDKCYGLYGQCSCD